MINKIEFKESTHTYTFNDVDMVSVTTFLKRFKAPFMRDKIAEMKAKKDGVKKEDLIAEWTKKGRDACEFGTKIHKHAENIARSDIVPIGIKYEVIKDIPKEYSSERKDIILKGVTGRLRNESMFKLACSFRERDLTPEETYQTLNAINKKNNPPLPEYELKNLIGNAYSYQKQSKSRTMGNDREGNYYRAVVKYFKEHKSLTVIETEKVICLPSHKLAGTVDLIMKSDDGKIFIYDWKTNKAIDQFSKYGKRLLKPFEYLPECNFIEYSLQLNLYAEMFRRMGMKNDGLYIIHLTEDGYKEYKCEDLRNEIDVMLQIRAMEII